MIFCMLLWMLKLSKIRSTFKGKDLFLRSKFFPLTVNPYFKGRQKKKKMRELFPLKVYLVTLRELLSSMQPGYIIVSLKLIKKLSAISVV